MVCHTFYLCFFLLALTLRTNNWRVCSAGNIAKKNCGHFTVWTLYFLTEKCKKKKFFLQILSGLGRLSMNAFQIHRTHVVTTSTEKITFKTHFYMILYQFNEKNRRFLTLFPIFSSLLHWQSTMAQHYDISQYAIIFSKQYSHSSEKNNTTKIQPKSLVLW